MRIGREGKENWKSGWAGKGREREARGRERGGR